ncbi:MAG: hypothetical protein Q9163_005216 [Psora crenata]
MNAMDALPLSTADCLKVYLQETGEPYDKIVIGTIIAQRGMGEVGGKPEILHLKRAAHEDAYPNIWEIPGGKVEDSDPTILDAVKREVIEETGMEVVKVIGAVKSFDYAMEKKMEDAGGAEVIIRLNSLQLNFICVVAKYDVLVSPEEHSEYQFARRSMLAGLEMTEQMRAVVDEGLTWAEGYFVGLDSGD